MNENRNNPKVYLIVGLVIVFVFFIMIVLLNVATNVSKKKRHYGPITTTTKKAEEPIVVTDFNTSLALIIGDLEFYGNYDLEVKFSGARFNFKCEKYDEVNGKCSSGSATMDVGTAIVTLFSYEDEDDNLLNRSEECYIIVNGEYIVVVVDGKSSPGKAIIQTRNGEKVNEITDIITKYKLNDEIHKFLYPSIEDDKFNYYMCDSSKVKIVGLDLKNDNSLELYQNVDDAICN